MSLCCPFKIENLCGGAQLNLRTSSERSPRNVSETGRGGTLARLAAGHDVTIIYLTRGEAGVKHLPKEVVTRNPCDERSALAGMRSEEAKRASAFLGARVLFTDQPDGATSADCKECEEFTELLNSFNRDLVLTAWPLDTHR
jgi:LmbE family N-acetylglucosaminyl deacetylase